MKKLILVFTAFVLTTYAYAQNDSANHTMNSDMDNTRTGHDMDNSQMNHGTDTSKTVQDRKNTQMNHLQDTMHTAKPVPPVKTVSPEKPVPSQKPVQPKSSAKTDKDKMYLVPDSTLNKNKPK